MKPFDDEAPPGDANAQPVDQEELERSLTPPEDTAISPELLDELFEMEDPRVQSGADESDSDDDLDFIRMSGLTSPQASADLGAIDELPVVDEILSPPVSFYEPGVADVDAAMEPDAAYDSESVLDELIDQISAPVESAVVPVTDNDDDPQPILADSVSIVDPSDVVDVDDTSTSDSASLVVEDDSAVPETDPLVVDASEEIAEVVPDVVDVESPALEVDEMIIDTIADLESGDAVVIEPEIPSPIVEDDSSVPDVDVSEVIAEAEPDAVDVESPALEVDEEIVDSAADLESGDAVVIEPEIPSPIVEDNSDVPDADVSEAIAEVAPEVVDVEPPSLEVDEVIVDAVADLESGDAVFVEPDFPSAVVEDNSSVPEVDIAEVIDEAEPDQGEVELTTLDEVAAFEEPFTDVEMDESGVCELESSELVAEDEPADESEAVLTEADAAYDTGESIADDELPALPVPNNSDVEASEVIDLDTIGDEVFSDLVLPVSVEIESEVEATAEEAIDPAYTLEATDDVDLVECPETAESFADMHDDDQTLDAEAGDTGDDTTLDDSIIDDVLVDVSPDLPVDEPAPEALVAVESISESFPEPDQESSAHESAQEVPDDTLPVPEPVAKAVSEKPATRESSGRRSSRQHNRHQPSLHRILKAAAVVLVAGGAMAYVGYEAYRWFEVQIANPTTLYYDGEAAAASGNPLQASRLYEEFARRNTDHPLVADATFAAGYQMQQVETDDPELTRQYNQESLALLGEFARRYPDHPRAGRAQSLMGIIHYRKGDYRAAVDALVDRDAILRDPAATLPMLRTLARSYAQLGEYDAAHSTFTQAANSPGNPSPDTDYDELGEMYQVLAQTAETPDQHLAYQELAVEHWSHAARYPGINPTRKNAIRVKVDLFGKLGALSGSPPAIAVQTQRSDVVVPLEGGMRATQASFELTTPLPFGPIVKGVPGNDDPEPVNDPTTTLSPVEPSIDLTFEVVPEFPFEAEEDPVFNELASDPIGGSPQVRYHEIASGEQLYRIANDYGVSAADLMQWNQIENVDHIEIGQRLQIHVPESGVQ
jgi:tetratricopeptide (TPR) repeat protein